MDKWIGCMYSLMYILIYNCVYRKVSERGKPTFLLSKLVAGML